jgi:Glycosyltransferase family 87
VTGKRLPLIPGGVLVATLTGLCIIAWRDGSGVIQREGGRAAQRGELLFLALLGVAAIAYALAVLLFRRRGSLRIAIAIAVVVQLLPLGAPLMLSTDAWTYWSYGWIAEKAHGNPYRDTLVEYPGSPASEVAGNSWLDTITVYGPAFTAASEGVAALAGRSSDRAAWIFKSLAAAATLAAALLAARIARRPGLAVVVIGWNPVLAVHLAGGGHNDAWLGALILAALALGAAGHSNAEGGAWVTAIAVKWVPLVLLPLRLLDRRARKLPLGVGGLLAATVVVCALATWRYGTAWVGAFGPLVDNATQRTSYALPSRLVDIGVPDRLAVGLALAAFAVGYLALAWRAFRGHARLGLCACLTLATTPYLAVWYLGWAVPLAAVDDEDDLPLLVAVALTLYLLPQTIPR